MVKRGIDILNNIEKYKDYKYWYGGKGELATKELADRLKKENPSVWTDAYYQRALNDIDGKTRVCDCSGMVCGCYEIGNIGSSAINDKFSKTKDIKNGMVLWRQGHVGIYADGSVYQMKSIVLDFYVELYNQCEWTNILYEPSVDYDFCYEKGWHRDNQGWWYAYGTKRGSYYKNCCQQIDGDRYIFDKDGYVATVTTDSKGHIHIYNNEKERFDKWQ